MDLSRTLICPCRDRSNLIFEENSFICTQHDCIHSVSSSGFRLKDGVPIIVSDVKCDTVCTPEPDKIYVLRRNQGTNILSRLGSSISPITKKNCHQFVRALFGISAKPKVLIVGSGAKGAGTEELWTNQDITIVGVDIYRSCSVDVICDAHYLPFPDGFFDGVWIQAVLEHVVEPEAVVIEIHRVLKFGGIVYAETPFMQQVHEGAYDFTRYTVLGHRYLFKSFSAIDIGGNMGADVVLAWSARYFVWAVTRSKTAGRLIGGFVSIILKPFQALVARRSLYDSASGVYFFGRKTNEPDITHKELVALYDGQFR